MKSLLTTASLIAVLTVGPVWAQQQGNPAGMTPGMPQSGPGVPAPNQPNVPDRNFARAAAAGGLSEVELGQLAEHEGQSSAVREFGQRMVSDHSKANAQLKELAAAANIPLPNTPDAEHRSMREQLDQVHGAAFDGTYIRGQVIDPSADGAAPRIRDWFRARCTAEGLCVPGAAHCDAAFGDGPEHRRSSDGCHGTRSRHAASSPGNQSSGRAGAAPGDR